MRSLPVVIALASLLYAPYSQAITIKTIPEQTSPSCKQERGKAVDMVFVLDTTGSMGGLLQGAKTKIWRIVNDTMQSNRCGAAVRVGLVGYRDKEDAYVTKQVALSEDLDAVYAELMDFKAQGGGDEPEHVRLALHEGVNHMKWQANSKKIVFLVGDAPPHDDYNDAPSVTQTSQKAWAKGITINTLLAGDSQQTAKVWRSIAQYGAGEYFEIPQDGGSRNINTPYDKRLHDLSGELDGIYLPYGNQVIRQRALAKSTKMQSAIAAAPIEAQAERSINKSINRSAYSQDDLIQAIENGKVTLSKIPSQDLPDNMQKMSAAEREAYVAKQIQKRRELRAEIATVSKQREQYLQQHNKETPTDSFDQAVSRALSKQLK